MISGGARDGLFVSAHRAAQAARPRGVVAALRRAVVGATAALVPVTGLFAPAFVNPAAAVTPGVGFTADAQPTYQLNGIGWAATQSRGVVYVGGTFSAIRPPGAALGRSETTARNFVALNAATGRPTSCRPSFTGARAVVFALAMSPDGQTLYAGGRFSRVNSVAVSNLAAINLRTCTPIVGFRPQVSDGVRGLAVASNGTVYAAGDFLTVNGKARRHFAAVGPTGALGAWSPSADGGLGFAVALAPNGADAAIGGSFERVNGADSHALAIVSARSGALVHAYPNQFVARGSRVKSLAADASGIYTANEGRGGGEFDGRIALDPRTYRQRWRDLCLGATQDVLVDRGNLYAASHAHDCSRMGGFPNGRRQHLTVEGVNDPHLKVWWPDTNGGLGEAVGPRALVISSGARHRYLFAVGDFTTVNGKPQQGVLRLADGPDTGAPSPPSGLSATTTTAGRVQLRWRAGTDRDDRTLTYRIYRNSSSTPIATLRGDSDWWRRPTLSYVDGAVKPGTFYAYRLTASDSSGNTSTRATVGIRAKAPATG
jgi:hypothetical protein